MNTKWRKIVLPGLVVVGLIGAAWVVASGTWRSFVPAVCCGVPR